VNKGSDDGWVGPEAAVALTAVVAPDASAVVAQRGTQWVEHPPIRKKYRREHPRFRSGPDLLDPKPVPLTRAVHSRCARSAFMNLQPLRARYYALGPTVDRGESGVTLQITADGKWTVTIAPISVIQLSA
jgi:hypothetical protein